MGFRYIQLFSGNFINIVWTNYFRAYAYVYKSLLLLSTIPVAYNNCNVLIQETMLMDPTIL